MAVKDWMRAADQDREETVEILRHAYAEGRLDAAELDERTGVALRAGTCGELRHLVADLPPPRRNAGSAPSGPVRSLPAWPPPARRVTSVSALVLVAAIASVMIGAALRNLAVIALAVLAGTAISIRRGG